MTKLAYLKSGVEHDELFARSMPTCDLITGIVASFIQAIREDRKPDPILASNFKLFCNEINRRIPTDGPSTIVDAVILSLGLGPK